MKVMLGQAHFDKYTEEQIEALMTTCTERPPAFGYSGSIEGMFDTWGIGPVVETPQASVLDKSNREVLEREARKAGVRFHITHTNYWACGWVDHFSFQVKTTKGKPTKSLQWLNDWIADLAEYPIADDDHYSELCYNTEHEAFTRDVESLAYDVSPDETFTEEQIEALWSALRDDHSVFPGDGAVRIDEATLRATCAALGFATTDPDA